MAKNKRLTNKEKQARAELKKRMQDKGVLPPDKPKLNRKKFIDEAREEWNGRSSDCFIWEHYLMDAISYMLCQREGMSSRASLEAVGAAKVLKLAIRLREFSEEVREKGEHEYKLVDQYKLYQGHLGCLERSRQMSTAYKKMTSHGSISIPVAMRRELGIEPKDPMIVEEHQGEIRIKPYTLRCNFCGTTEDVHEFHGKGICEACATKAFEKLGGGQ